jgi:hypothetical protein
MALGAITLSNQAGRGVANVFFDKVTVVGDDAYPTGGSAFQAAFEAAIGAGRTVLAVIPVDGKGYQLAYDAATGKLKVYWGNNDGGADGPAVEVPNAEDLSAVTFDVLVLSK